MAVSNEQFLFCCIENSHGGTVSSLASGYSPTLKLY